MYINGASVYYKGTTQHIRKGDFLILMQPDNQPPKGNNIRAIVAKVAMSQVGYFMMGKVRIGGKSITLSGSYGSDGLPTTVPDEIWVKGVPLPDSLYEAWRKGGGWNGSGSEAWAMAAWGKTLIKKKR